MENLYLLPSYVDFQDFAKFLYKNCSSEAEEDHYFKGLPAVLLKLNTLKLFIQEQEIMDKASINNIIDILVESYIDTQLVNRHSKAYKDMYNHLYEALENK